MYLEPERYLAALRRILRQILSGSKLDYHDNTTEGDKSTHCSWGLCSKNKEQWPDIADALKYRATGQHCPFDKDQSKFTAAHGCFHRCRIFQSEKLPTRTEAVTLYQETIDASSP